MKIYENFARKGTTEQRSYYIPFSEDDEVKEKYGIIDRSSSSEFISLDGIWKIKQLSRPENVELNEELTEEIDVPSCVQMKNYDGLQYINCRFPFPCMPPYVPHDNPTWHYRRTLTIEKNTPLAGMLDKGKVELPDEDCQLAMYELVQEYLEAQGL